METPLDNIATGLLLHLGVEIVHNVHSRPDGSVLEEINIYSDRRQLNHVLGWSSRQFPGPEIRVFEGPRPPF